MRFPGNLRLAFAVLGLLLKKTALIAGPLLCLLTILGLSIQTPDLLTEFWTRLVIMRVFGPSSPNSYLARDPRTAGFFLLVDASIQPTGTYRRPIVLRGENDATLVLVPTAMLRRIGILYAMILPYAFVLALNNNTSQDALDFVLPLFNAAIALVVAYFLYTLLSSWYWDVRYLGAAEISDLYRSGLPLGGSRVNGSLHQFLWSNTSAVAVVLLSVLPLLLAVLIPPVVDLTLAGVAQRVEHA